MSEYSEEVLGDLKNLTKKEIKNQYLRALIFQLYENNGVVKRKDVDNMVKLISAEDRKKLWNIGIKIGRYHVYLPKMLKPKAVTFRINLWKLFYNDPNNYQIPKFGLNFISGNNYNNKFLLLCGFENFNSHYVRIDMLEKLFIKILAKTSNRKFKIDAEMMNLLGCSKEDFYKLMVNMNYKKDKLQDTYIFLGDKKKKKTIFKNKDDSNPFNKLTALNLK